MGGGASADDKSVTITPAKSQHGATSTPGRTPVGPTGTCLSFDASTPENGGSSRKAPARYRYDWEIEKGAQGWERLQPQAESRLEEAYIAYNADRTTEGRFTIGKQLLIVNFATMVAAPTGARIRRSAILLPAALDTDELDPSSPLAAEASTNVFRSPDRRRKINVTLSSTITAHAGLVYCMCFSGDGKRILSAARDGTCKLWELETGYVDFSLKVENSAVPLCCSLAPSKELGAIGVDDCRIRVFNAGDTIPMILSGHGRKVYGVAFSSDSKTLVSGSMDKEVRTWDLKTQQCTRVISGQHKSSVFSIATSSFSPHMAVSGSDDNTLARYDLRQANPTVAKMIGHSHTVWASAIRFDDEFILSGAMDGKVLLWDARKLSTPLLANAGSHGPEAPVHCVEFFPDGSKFLSSSRDRTWRIWDTQGAEIAAASAMGTDDATPAPPGRSSLDPCASVTTLGGGGQDHLLATVEAHAGHVFRVNYNALTNQVISCGADGTVKLWDLDL